MFLYNKNTEHNENSKVKPPVPVLEKHRTKNVGHLYKEHKNKSVNSFMKVQNTKEKKKRLLFIKRRHYAEVETTLSFF